MSKPNSTPLSSVPNFLLLLGCSFFFLSVTGLTLVGASYFVKDALAINAIMAAFILWVLNSIHGKPTYIACLMRTLPVSPIYLRFLFILSFLHYWSSSPAGKIMAGIQLVCYLALMWLATLHNKCKK